MPFEPSFIANNPAQGKRLRVLFVCTAGVLRSPTAAHWSIHHKGWNTRSAGIDAYAVPTLTFQLLNWAQRIYVMEPSIKDWIRERFSADYDDTIRVLKIPDKYDYMEPKLVATLRRRLDKE